MPGLARRTSGENLERDGNWVGGWMDLRDGAETMSLDGRSGGTAMARLDEHEQRTVHVRRRAAQPADQPAPRLRDDPPAGAARRPTAPGSRCSWAFPAEVASAEGFDPAYAVDFWDLTNRQDWAACESVQRGMNAPHYEPGPLAPGEDGVYQFVSYVARAYQGIHSRLIPLPNRRLLRAEPCVVAARTHGSARKNARLGGGW